MWFSPRRWRLHHLLGSWGLYWAGLAAVTLGSFARVAWRISNLPDGHANISAGFDGAKLNLSATVDGATVWGGSAGLGMVVLWVAGPPLLLWVAWLMWQPRGRSTTLDGPATEEANAYLGAAPFTLRDRDRDRDARVAERRPVDGRGPQSRDSRESGR